MDERAKQILGRRVEETRRDLGISKVDFCVATGISRPYLDRIEDGTANFTLKVLFKIAPALGMTVSELLEASNRGYPSTTELRHRDAVVVDLAVEQALDLGGIA
ncbi:MAG: helix-turn-helix domain-containing protein [Collinsella sp.]